MYIVLPFAYSIALYSVCRCQHIQKKMQLKSSIPQLIRSTEMKWRKIAILAPTAISKWAIVRLVCVRAGQNGIGHQHKMMIISLVCSYGRKLAPFPQEQQPKKWGIESSSKLMALKEKFVIELFRHYAAPSDKRWAINRVLLLLFLVHRATSKSAYRFASSNITNAKRRDVECTFATIYYCVVLCVSSHELCPPSGWKYEKVHALES